MNRQDAKKTKSEIDRINKINKTNFNTKQAGSRMGGTYCMIKKIKTAFDFDLIL